MPSTQLMRQYGIGKGTVLRLLRERGAAIRRQGMDLADVKEAAALYRDGRSLAKVAEVFGVSPTTVRTALLTAGVAMRSATSAR